jgi:hypothetical protein
MRAIFYSMLSFRTDRILCYYFNATSKIQIIRSGQSPNWYFNRVVFPKERLLFEALPDAVLEIYEDTENTIKDSISCAYLRVNEGKSKSSVLDGSVLQPYQTA